MFQKMMVIYHHLGQLLKYGIDLIYGELDTDPF
jgi:hypothetical protein